MTLVYIMALFLVVSVAYSSWFEWVQMPKYRKSGLYPEEGKGTLEDVKRLKKLGERSLATRLYRQLTQTSLKEASRAVREMSTD
jgi:hypothetical protein